MTRTLVSASAVLLAAVLCQGCAGHLGSRSPHQLVKEGEPAVEGREPAQPAPDSLAQYVAKVRSLASRARPAPNPLPTLEARDRALATALLLAASAPTAENLRKVGDEYRRVGVLDMAFRYYNRALRADQTDAAAYDGLARIWRDWGFPDLGLGDASRAVYYARSSGVSYNTLGTVMQAMGNRRGARAAYEQAHRADPHASYALTNLCYLSFLEANADAALGECRRALELDPGSKPARNNLALIYASQGRLDLARSELFRDGDEAASQFNMGMIYMATSDYVGAATAFQAALVARPSFSAAEERARQARALAR